jgi:hypothetical protein
MFKVIEKNNPLAVHCVCDSKERAENWINNLAPEYCKKGYFMDKTLTLDSFTIKEVKQ